MDDPGQNKGHVSQFIKQHVSASNIRRIKFIINGPYPHGLYYVKQDDNNVFFVSPNIKTCQYSDATFIAGDHFSLPFAKSKKEVQLHLTTYTPMPTDVNVGIISHYPRNVFSDGVKLPIKGYDTDVFKKMGDAKNHVLDFCREYIYLPKASGGGKSKRVVNTNTPIAHAVSESKVSLELSELLCRAKVKRVIAFGYLANNKWNIMLDLVRPENSKLEREFSFELDMPQYGLFQKKLIKILKQLVI